MEIGFSKYTAGGGGGSNSKSSEGFIDRSKVRILLCDNDAKSSEHVFTLLINCSYQVTSVRSARQVIDALNAEGPDIDIILAEVDLPMAKGMKMLKYITRDKDLRRIPVIMMSAQDEVSVVVKCLRLGAADYLVKPLRTNELLNLWTHMWRRRRLLGLAEKNVLIYDFDVVGSDPSDANTTSSTLFSDDTDEKSRKSANPEIGMLIHEEEYNAAVPAVALAAEPPATNLLGYRPGVPGISDRRTGQCSLGPKKTEWKVGESSAFLTYVKSSILKNNSQVTAHFGETAVQTWREQEGQNIQAHETGETWEKCSQGDDFPTSGCVPDSQSLERSSTPPASVGYSQQNHSKEEDASQGLIHPRNEPQVDVSSFHAHTYSPYPYYMPGMVNQIMIPSSAPLYQKNLHGQPPNHATPPMLSQYSNFSQCPPHVPGMATYPFYQANMYLQPGQLSTSHPWPSFGSGTSSSTEVKVGKVDRREAALIKFRQKRKERCFDKKIRYVNRKKLAEKRPRIRGQFVRKTNGVNVDLNGQPTSGDFDDDEEEDEDEQASRDYSPEDDAS